MVVLGAALRSPHTPAPCHRSLHDAARLRGPVCCTAVAPVAGAPAQPLAPGGSRNLHGEPPGFAGLGGENTWNLTQTVPTHREYLRSRPSLLTVSTLACCRRLPCATGGHHACWFCWVPGRRRPAHARGQLGGRTGDAARRAGRDCAGGTGDWHVAPWPSCAFDERGRSAMHAVHQIGRSTSLSGCELLS